MVKYARDVAAGLSALHNINDANDTAMAAYLDLKPANLVVDNGHVLLSDFNAGQMIMQSRNHTPGDSSEEQCPLKREMFIHGASYRSPEEMFLNIPLSEKADIYALAGVIFFIISGYKPFNSMETQEIIHSVGRGEIPKVPSRYTSSDDPIIQGLIKIMHECYSFQPSNRPSARQVVEYLDAILSEGTKEK